jgi:ketosteroid isomerase-like protein
MRGRILALALASLLSPFARTQDEANRNAGAKVLALEGAWNRAEETGDIRALSMLFDDSLLYIDEYGSLQNKAQFLAHTRDPGAPLQSLITETISVHVYSDTAVVVGNYHAKGTRRGKPYEKQGRFVDTWVLKKGTWVCVAAQATPTLR